jgi:hypothetical protein
LTIALLGAGWFGIFVWKFLGSVPAATKLGFRILLSAVLPTAPRPGGLQPDEPAIDPIATGLEAIAARDRGFAANTFLAWADQLPPEMATGWAKGDLAACRSAMTEDCWQGQQSMMERHLPEGWRQSAGSATFRQSHVVAAAAEADGDRITIRVQATCPDEATRVVRGRRIAEWVEDWVFRRGVTVAPPASGITLRVLWRGEWRLDRMDHVAIHMEKPQQAA